MALTAQEATVDDLRDAERDTAELSQDGKE